MIASEISTRENEFSDLQELVFRQEFSLALPLLQSYVASNPNCAAARRLAGHCLFELGLPEEALIHLHAALSVDKRDTITLNIIGNCMVQLEKKVEAASVFRHAISIKPECADSRNNLGMVLLELLRPEEALPHFLSAIKLNPSHDKSCVNLIGLLLKERQYDKAHEIIEEVKNYNLTSEKFLSICYDLYFKAKRFEHADQFARMLIANFPSQEAYFKLNCCLLQQHKHDEFVEGTLNVRRMYPDNAANHIHAITTLSDNGERQLARTLIDEMLQRDSSDIEANISSAYDYLHRRNFSKGWACYEHRLAQQPGQVHYNQKPDWDGTSLQNRRVLVLAEQGFGDVILYARFLNNLQSDARKVYLLCEPRLRCIVEFNFPQITCLTDPTLLSVLDHQVSVALASLPMTYGKHIDQIQHCGRSYIDITQHLKDCWEFRLRQQIQPSTPRIGFSLNSGIDDYSRLKRSCPFSTFLKMLPAKRMTLIDLDHRQDESFRRREDETKANGNAYVSYEGVTSNLDHLCALISRLDLVITTQQTNAHICGAMGIPCIVMLPIGPHFIYGYEGDTTPWYPSLYLLRLRAWHDWEHLSGPLQAQLERLFPDYFC